MTSETMLLTVITILFAALVFFLKDFYKRTDSVSHDVIMLVKQMALSNQRQESLVEELVEQRRELVRQSGQINDIVASVVRMEERHLAQSKGQHGG